MVLYSKTYNSRIKYVHSNTTFVDHDHHYFISETINMIEVSRETALSI